MYILSNIPTLNLLDDEKSYRILKMDKNVNSVYRFAPSPTGLLHVGGARTAIFNWLLAKKEGAKFLLRIEDTDEKRSNQESLDQILSSLDWLDIKWDGSPLFQSQQKDRHKQVASELLEKDKAYRCFCTTQFLQKERKKSEADKRAFLYTGRCRHLSTSEIESNLDNNRPFTLRLKIDKGVTTFNDDIRGDVTVIHAELDDFVILRSDGSPVYHLAVVVDDHDMGITHVVRGDDHISNTPKQILIHEALGWHIPQYAHVPLICGYDGARLSKRHGATAVEDFRKIGFLPEALFNYLCLLGWAPGDDREIMSRDEIISSFSLDRISKKDSIFDEKKLKWMNGKYLSQKGVEDITYLLHSYLINNEQDKIEKDKDNFSHLIELVKIRAQTVEEVYESIKFYFDDPDTYEENGINKYFRNHDVVASLKNLIKSLNKEEVFEAENLEKIIREFADTHDIKAGTLIHPLRLALTGRTNSPGIFDVMQVLGKETVVRRVKKAFTFIAILSRK
jgi:glutamyl-tRNA synthetase